MTAPLIAEKSDLVAPGKNRSLSSAVWPALVNATAAWTDVRPELFAAMDWEAFLQAAEYHGVLPIMAQRLLESEVSFRLEPAMKDKLRRAFQSNLVRTFPLVEEVRRVCNAFCDDGIAVIPYKGPVLAEELWGSSALRECADIDFLVRREDVERAGGVLDALGYARGVDLAARLRPALVRNASEEQFRHRETNLLLELQWAPAPRVFALAFDTDAMWQRARTIPFGGGEVLSPSPEDLLRLLCIHGWKHNWSRLIWLGDIAQLLRRFEIDRDRLLPAAGRERNLRIVALALKLAQRVFGTVVPSQFDLPDGPLDQLAAELACRMDRIQPCNYGEWHRYMLAARDGHWDRMRQVATFLFTPGLGEYAACDLPAWASSGYRAIRLGRVLRLIPGKTRD